MSFSKSWFYAVPRRAGLRAVLALSVVLVTLAGYGGGPAVPAHAASHEVAMREYKFVQNALRVAVGDTVTWANYDPDSHNVAILEGPELNVSPEQRKGEKWSMTFSKPGRYHYYCEFHPWMVADVIVGDNTSTASTERAAQTFKETGKSVRGKFLQYWQKNGGLAQQGYPISEEMVERSETDRQFYTVQYFERAVFELHPEEKPPYDVLLSLLGTFEYQRKYPNGAPGQQPNNSAGSVLFKETARLAHIRGVQREVGVGRQDVPSAVLRARRV
jgi:plastocyanin